MNNYCQEILTIFDICDKIPRQIKKDTQEEKMGFFNKLKQGLNKTKTSIDDKINNVFSNFR